MMPGTDDPASGGSGIDWIALERCGRAAAMARLGRGLLGIGRRFAAWLAMPGHRGQPLSR